METNVKKEPMMLYPRSTFLFLITALNIKSKAIKLMMLAKLKAKLAASICPFSQSHNCFEQLKTYAYSKFCVLGKSIKASYSNEWARDNV
jgi:hypothetical protein